MPSYFALILLAASAQPPLTLATYAYPKYDRGAALAPLGRALADRLDRPVLVRLYQTPDALAEGIAAGEVDLAVTNLATYARVGRRSGVRAVAVLDVPAPTLERYRGVLIARANTGLTSIDQVRARADQLRYSEVLPGSTSGALVQAEALIAGAAGPVRFSASRFAGTHEAALDDVLAGRADLAALAEDPWRKLVMVRPADAAKLRLIWRSAPLPPGPVICVERPELDCGKVARIVVGGLADAPGAAAALAAGWSETEGATGFKPVDPRRYAGYLTSEAVDRAEAAGR